MTEPTDQPRRLQISITTILLLTLTVAIWVGVIQQRLRASRLQTEIVKLQLIETEFEKLEIRATEYDW